MESIRYIFHKKSVQYLFLCLYLFNCFYKITQYSHYESYYYVGGLMIKFVFNFYSIIFFYLVNLHHTFFANIFISIRYKSKEKVKLHSNLILCLTYTILLLIGIFLPCLFSLNLKLIVYTLEMGVFIFLLGLFCINLINLLNFYTKYYTGFSLVLCLYYAFYGAILYPQNIDLFTYDLVCIPRIITCFSLIIFHFICTKIIQGSDHYV